MSDQNMSDVKKQLNQTAFTLFALLRLQTRLKMEYEEKEQRLKRDFEAQNSDLEDKINAAKSKLAQLVEDNRAELIKKGKQSFDTSFSIFAYRKASPRIKITDKAGFVDKARKEGIVKKTCKSKWVTTPSAEMANDFFKKNPEYIEEFDEFIELPGGETLSIKPNAAYLDRHDTPRLTPESIKLTD